MSEFDKEKEREKLREKYERDQQDREATEQMSELLLKGATMTNRHCEECGDPVFRYDGQEFCPTCQRPAGDAGSGGEPDAEEAETGSTDADSPDSGGTPGESDAPDPGRGEEATPGSGGSAASTGDRGGSPAGGRRAPAGDRESGTRESTPEPQRRRTETQTPPTDPPERTPSGAAPGDGDTAAAAASLRRTLGYFARRAEATEDPATAREHLRAAREAAEALAALRR